MSSRAALFTDKGHPLRITVTFTNNECIIVHPLRGGVAGIVLSPPLKPIQRIASLETNAVHLLDDEGKIIRSINRPADSDVLSIETIVVYPDGAVWTGRVLKEKESQVSLIAWSRPLLSALQDEELLSLMNGATEWRHIPTLVSIVGSNRSSETRWIQHSCPDCDRASKIISSDF